jgi:hypothetical protein
MHIKNRQEIINKINAATFQGKTTLEKKPLYIEQNSFNINLDEPIYRIFQYEFINQDINNNTLTHVKACPDVWGDEFENPLLKAQYTDDVTGESIYLTGVVDDFHALSWTIDADENEDSWDDFSHGEPAIRIKTTPRKLLENLMDVNDKYFMFHHHIGKVKYENEQYINDWINDPNYHVHLDSLGQSLALSLMLLRTRFSSEQEIRLLYSYKPQSDNPWVDDNIKKKDVICIVPFSWDGIIEEIILGETMDASNEASLLKTLKKHNINCNVKNSIYR